MRQVTTIATEKDFLEKEASAYSIFVKSFVQVSPDTARFA
jgi:hypothetical protein